MYKTIFLCIIMMGSITSQSQSVYGTLEWWRESGLLKSFPSDLDTLSHFVTQLNVSVIAPLKEGFDSCRVDSAGRNTRKLFQIRINDQYLPCLDSTLQKIEQSHFYNNDSSFLFYYTKKELKNYLSTLNAFKVETKVVISETDNTMSVFNNSNFLNAYFNVIISHSLLLAAMDNLERYYLLGNVTDSIAKISVTTEGCVVEINSQLTSEYKPYYRNSQHVKENSKDKISSAANTILYDNRKNWWWRTLTGGVVGGLVAGMLIVTLK